MLRAPRLVLLGDARHHGDDVNLPRIDAHLLSVVGLEQDRGHRHGRAARGGVGDELRVELLEIADPPRGTRGQHRERAIAVEPLDKLVGLLHDGQVGPEVGIEDGLEAQDSKAGDHPAGERGPGGRPKPSPMAARIDGPSGRRRACQDRPRPPDLLRGGLLKKCGRRADVDALAALDADGLVHLRPWAGLTTVVKPRPCWLRL